MKQQLSNVRSLKNADNNSEIKSLQAGSRGGDVTKDNIIRNSKTDFFNIIKNVSSVFYCYFGHHLQVRERVLE